MVTNVADSLRVVANGADVVVAQGAEAGGHRSHFTMPPADRLGDLSTFTLVPAVAGGVVDGRGLVAALALGAAGVLLGSRFLLTRESTRPGRTTTPAD